MTQHAQDKKPHKPSPGRQQSQDDAHRRPKDMSDSERSKQQQSGGSSDNRPQQHGGQDESDKA